MHSGHIYAGKVPASTTLQAGQRVTRKKTCEGGTVIEADAVQIQIKWDRGRTSYYRRGKDSDALAAE